MIALKIATPKDYFGKSNLVRYQKEPFIWDLFYFYNSNFLCTIICRKILNVTKAGC